MYRNIFKLQPQFHPSRLNEAHSSPRSTLTHVNVIDATTFPNGVHCFSISNWYFLFLWNVCNQVQNFWRPFKDVNKPWSKHENVILSLFFCCVHWVLNAQLFRFSASDESPVILYLVVFSWKVQLSRLKPCQRWPVLCVTPPSPALHFKPPPMVHPYRFSLSVSPPCPLLLLVLCGSRF